MQADAQKEARGPHSLSAVFCHVPETVCCRSSMLLSCSLGAFLRGDLPGRQLLSSSSLQACGRLDGKSLRMWGTLIQ